MLNRVVHFEIHADDVERAKKFYQEVFGWEITQWADQPYWMVMTAPKGSTEPGINGGMLKRPPEFAGTGVNAFVCTMQVDDIDATIAKLESLGSAVVKPKFAYESMAWQAYYKDTEGNVFGIHQADANAK